MVTRAFSLWSEETQDQELVKAALDFANLGDPTAWAAVCRGRNPDGSIPLAPVPPPNFLAAERDYLRAALNALLGHANPSPEMLDAWLHGLRAVPVSLVYDDPSGEFQVVMAAPEIPRDPPSPSMALALLLLRQGARVCQCATCKKFFLEQSTRGMSRRRYCSNQCMEDAHKATAAKRVRDSRFRAKQRATQKRKRRRS